MSQTGKELAVQEYIELLKKYRLWILMSIIGMAIAFGCVRYMTYKPMFTAQTSLLVTSNTIELEEGEIKNGTTSSDYNVSNNVLMTFSEVIDSQTLQNEVKEELSIEDLGEITVSNNGGSVIRINVNHSVNDNFLFRSAIKRRIWCLRNSSHMESGWDASSRYST